MTDISIRERGIVNAGPVVTIDGQEYAITLTDPFSAAEEQRLEWYFEQHLKFPFTDQVKAQAAAASITTYGEALFNALFTDRRAYARYQATLQQGIEKLTFEIAGSPAFHRLHWEALKDPDLPQPFALQTPFVRRNLAPRTVEAIVRSSPTINLLIVTARPGGARDVGYRTISRPLVNALRQTNLRVNVEILRPGSYEALVQHLEAKQDQHGAGYYHVVHFDVHGALLTHAQFEQIEKALPGDHYTFQKRFGRADLPVYTDHKAFLFLEGPQPGLADPVAASELADLLINHQVPIVILNACQSAKQLKAAADQPTASESSLGSQLMQAGVQMVLAMAYSVTVSAAALLMQQLYSGLFTGSTLTAAIRRARLGLANRKGRRVYFNQTIDLEDWLLPVVYQNQPQPLTTRPFTADESAIFYQRQATRYPDATVTYQFVGRDLDILHIERALLLQRNILLVQGMGGAGKTTLLHHLAHWWQTTGFVDQVFYFGYDQRAYTRQQIMDAIARQLFDAATYLRTFQPLGEVAQQALLAEQLRGQRHLLILDNLESITGAQLAIQHTLSAPEQQALHRFLRDLAGGQTLVLLGSRSDEAWLAPGTFADNVYRLPGLDPEAASALADLILARHAATGYRADPDFQKLLRLLDGYPLPLEVVLANLARQTPAAVLEALQAGDVALDTGDAAHDKTQNIVACIAYSHSNLSPDAQQLLLCLAPFTSVINTQWLPQYFNQLQAQPALTRLPITIWLAVVQAAVDWGLLALHPELDGYLRIQPILPYFLKNRLQQTDPTISAAIDTAFHHHYTNIAQALAQAIKSKAAAEQQTGVVLIGLEYENLAAALHLALTTQATFYQLYEALFRYLLARQAHQVALTLSETVWQAHQDYDPQQMTGKLGEHFSLVLNRLAHQQLTLRQYETARETYAQEIELVRRFVHYSPEQKGISEARTYHQLGVVAQAQRQWAQAEQHYQQALAITIEFNDRYSQASTYHQLGRVAQAQRQWAQAEQHYQQALALKIEFNDRYSQARTYHQLGMVAQAQRQWAQAEQHYQQALAIYIEFNDRYEQAGTYHQLGRVAEEQRQWAQAEQHYQQALAIYIEFNDRYEQAGTYHQLGSVAQEQRQWAQAEQHYQQALALFIEFNDRYSQASTYHQLGSVAQAQRQWAQAEQHYQQALALFIEFNDKHGQARLLHSLGTVAYEQRQWAQARDYLLQDLTISVEYNDDHGVRITLRSLARLWQASGLTDLPAAVAAILNSTPAAVEAAFTQTLADAATRTTPTAPA